MADLVVVHLLEDRRALLVAGRPERVAIEDREVQVGLLEGEPHGGEERARAVRGLDDGGDVAPEVVGSRVIVEARAERLEALDVEPAVALLVGEGDRELVPQLGRQVGPAQQRPGEELDRHELVMSEAREAGRACRRVLERARLGQRRQTVRHLERFVALGGVDVERLTGIGVVEGQTVPLARGGQLTL